MSGNILLFVGMGLMILTFVLDRFFEIDTITSVTVYVISVAMVIFGLLIDPSNSKPTMEEITDAISSEYPSAEIINESKYVNVRGYIKFADGGIYTYEYENGILFIKDTNEANEANDVKNIIQIKRE